MPEPLSELRVRQEIGDRVRKASQRRLESRTWRGRRARRAADETTY